MSVFLWHPDDRKSEVTLLSGLQPEWGGGCAAHICASESPEAHLRSRLAPEHLCLPGAPALGEPSGLRVAGPLAWGAWCLRQC